MFKFSRKTSAKPVATVGGAVTPGALSRSGSSAPRSNISTVSRSSSRNREKASFSLVSIMGRLFHFGREKNNASSHVFTEENDPGTRSPARFSVALTIPRIVGLSTGMMLLLLWAFFLGVLMGRDPDNTFFRTAPAPVVAAATQEANLPAPAPAAPEKKPVLLPEELRFLNDFNRKNTAPDILTSAPLPTDIPQLTEAQKESAEKSMQQAIPTLTVTPPLLKTPPVAPKPLTPPKDDAPSSDNAQFEYVFQVAAGPDKKSILSLQNRLRAAKLAVSVETVEKNGSPLYRVLVTFKGSPGDVPHMRSELLRQDLKNSFLRAKNKL